MVSTQIYRYLSITTTTTIYYHLEDLNNTISLHARLEPEWREIGGVNI